MAIKKRSLLCITTPLRVKERKSGAIEFVFSSKHTDGIRRVIFRISKNRKTWVHCSCPYFTYYLEYALHFYKASAIVNSNGMYPVITNPAMRPYLCKHAYAASNFVAMFMHGKFTIDAARKMVKKNKVPKRRSTGRRNVKSTRYK